MTTECTSIRGRSAGLLVIFVLALQIAGCGQKAEDGPILLKFPHVTAPATPKGQTADRFKQLVEERLQGRVVVEVYPSGQLMDDDDSLDALAFGEVQMIAISLSKLDRLTHKFQIFDLPFLFPDLITVERFQASADGKVLLEAMEDKGLRGLTYWHNGMKQMGAPVPLRTPADAAGLKFRIMESDVLQAQVLQIGGSPQKMALGEVYQALQTGAIDAQENTWSNMYSSKFYEVQKYMTETNHGYLGYLVTVNTSFWDSLPEDIRVELESILREVTEWGNERSETINLEDRQKIVESGISEVVTLTPDELRQWQEAMKPVWTEFEGNIGSSLISAALAARQ
ncbi:MAG: DctP family TRAP transporter solute-binding subunit [Gammaproteobacteria bacterium]|nr:DctP family TRAP transporter solute-binding subunit [Gammaproteobacteria bacterium]